MHQEIEASKLPKQQITQPETSGGTGLFPEYERYFHAPNMESFASVGFKGHIETWPVDSEEFKRLVSHAFWLATHTAMPKKLLKETIALCDAKACFDGPTRKVFTRIGRDDHGNIVVDLADAKWQAAVVTKNGWSVVDHSPIPLIRKQGMAALPVPENGGRPFFAQSAPKSGQRRRPRSVPEHVVGLLSSGWSISHWLDRR